MTTPQWAKALTKRKFVAWLRSKKPGSIVGRTVEDCGCPVAVYIRETSGVTVSVMEDVMEPVDARGCTAGPGRALPKWAAEFISKLDITSGLPWQTPVTARRCLKALEARSA